MRLGLDPDAFWQKAPCEIARIINARVEWIDDRAEARFDEFTYLAWRTVDLSRARQLPALQSLLSKRRPPTSEPPQTPEQMLEIGKMLTLALGGTVIAKAAH